jgi:hypothetical protein
MVLEVYSDVIVLVLLCSKLLSDVDVDHLDGTCTG